MRSSTANEQLIDRRRFMEAVLSGVSAGVIGLDSQDRITLLSRSAEQLLATTEAEVVGKKLADVLPVFAPVLEKRDEQHKPRARSTRSRSRSAAKSAFSLSASRASRPARAMSGSVVTFDDITELVSAQRTSAWADVARRIAHEIKNPLTPIILSAERIRRKYGKVITEDRETFDKLTATIERQAGDIKTMVDEFASFARVPKPVMEQTRPARGGAGAGHPVPRGARQRRLRDRFAARARQASVRPPAAHAGGDQPRQERHRGRRDPPRAAPTGWQGRVEVTLDRDRDRIDIERRRQRPGPAEAEPHAAARTLRHDQGTQGHRARPRDRAENHRAARRRADARGRAAGPRAHAGARVRITCPVELASRAGSHPRPDRTPAHPAA